MGFSAIIELAIGMIFVYSLLSILVTQINNIVINALNLKAGGLKRQLDAMLTDPVIRAKIMAHPLIGMVEAEVSEFLLIDPDARLTEEMALKITEQKKARVEYIDSSTFVDVLVDVLTERAGGKLYESLEQVIDKMDPSVEKSRFRALLRQVQLSGTGLEDLRNMINILADPETRRQMLVALNLVDAALDKLKAESSDMIPLLLGVRQIKDKYLETALMAVLNTATNLQQARGKIGEWFDNSMERASQQYMRHLQKISLLISFLLALLLNVDSLHMARILWEDSALRTSVAVTAAATGPQIIEDFQNQPATGESTGTTEDLTQSVIDAQSTLNALLELRLPIGWTYEPISEDTETTFQDSRLTPRNIWEFSPANNPGFLEVWVLKIFGLLLTTIALTQGAPFWFDLLRRLTRGGNG